MHYVFLVIGILTEICGSTLLKFTDGFQKKFLAALCLLAYGIAYYMVALSMKVLPLNIAYATWSGAGTMLTMVIGMFCLRNDSSHLAILGCCCCWAASLL